MRQILLFVFFLLCFWACAQHQDNVDFVRGEIRITPFPSEKKISGKVVYRFKVLADVDSVFLDAKSMKFSTVEVNAAEAKYSNSGKTISIYKKFKKGQSYELLLDYAATPKQTLYFIGWDDGISGNEQVWTQGQGKYTSHWVPSFDDMEEKVEFDLQVVFNRDFEIVANGALEKVEEKDSLGIWYFDMQKPMSSYLLAFAIGDYEKQELIAASGIPIENYYYPQDSLRVEPTYRYTKEIFDFLESEIGVPYPWQNYKQIPVRDFLYAGMENTGATIFSDGYVIDSVAFVDKNYVNVNAHELAHQWFGNLVTEKDGEHHWLHEGFATFYAYLAERKIFGDDHFYWKFYRSLLQLQNAVDRGESQSLLNPKASSLTFYEKGAWALFALRNQVGVDAFKKGIEGYLKKYSFENVTVSDFVHEMEKASGADLSRFRKEWLESPKLPFSIAEKMLVEKSASLALLASMENDFKKAQNIGVDFERYWNLAESVNLKEYIVENHFGTLTEEITEKVFASNSIALRQALALKTDSIPSSLKVAYESLLEDKSYVTLENALFKLWVSFPEDREKYLEKTKGVDGLPNKNIRLLWLTLAILTNEYEALNTQEYFSELSSYTSREHSWETRMAAFQYVSEIGFNDRSLMNLLYATEHHSWQFKKYARNLVDELLKDSDYKRRIETLSRELKKKEFRYITNKLNKK